MDLTIREIELQDNKAMAVIIRESLTEFGLNVPGTAYFDESTDHLSESFQIDKCTYFVAADGTKIIGGGGVYPTDGLPADTVELVKMYLHRDYRGKGLGKILIKKCIAAAEELGYKNIYLETLPELKDAVSAYQKLGFKLLGGPIGNTGHFTCTIWMLYQIPA